MLCSAVGLFWICLCCAVLCWVDLNLSCAVLVCFELVCAVLCWVVLNWFVLCWIVLNWFVLCCAVLSCAVMICFKLVCVVKLFWIALFCAVLVCFECGLCCVLAVLSKIGFVIMLLSVLVYLLSCLSFNLQKHSAHCLRFCSAFLELKGRIWYHLELEEPVTLGSSAGQSRWNWSRLKQFSTHGWGRGRSPLIRRLHI